MILRPYQAQALDDLWGWFGSHGSGNPIIDACVGAGKSLLIASIAQRINNEAPGARVLVLVHQEELLQQNVDKLNAVWPGASVGIYSASMGLKQMGRQVTFATIGSVHKAAHLMGNVALVLADECHLINPKETGMWRTFIATLSRYCPAVRIVGLTGTPFRGNGVWLTAGDEPLFHGIAARVTMTQLLELGFLSPLVPAPTNTKIDTSSVKTSGDDFVVSDLARVTDTDELVEATCDEIVQLARDRKKWLVFAVTIEHAGHVMEALKRRGVLADVVTGKTPKAQRKQMIADFRAGRLRCLVNVGVLTTGFDVPEVDFIALLRATKSPVLYVQIGGRGMRIANGKVDCLWADFTDTTTRLGPIDSIQGRPPARKGSGEAPHRLCDRCGSRNHASATECSSCGFKFPEPERIKHGREASAAAVLSSQVKEMYAEHRVDSVVYRRHVKLGAPDSLRVGYMAGLLEVASEWVHFDHEGFPRRKAEAWWTSRATIDATPPKVADALEWLEYDRRILRQPLAVVVSKAGKYPQVVGYKWE